MLRWFAALPRAAHRMRLFFVLSVAGILLAACGHEAPTMVEETQILLGTVSHLKIRAADHAAAEEALRTGQKQLMQVQQDAEGEELRALEAAAGTGAWTRISPALYETLGYAQEIARRTDGAFDVTAGALTALWDAARREKTPPTDEMVQEARTHVGYAHLEMRKTEDGAEIVYEARLMKAGMRIDRGALIKGAALDVIHPLWQRADTLGALADLGTSSILAMGTNEEGEPWQIGIRNPRGAERSDILMVLPLTDEVLSVSGDDEHYFLYEGKRYHHLIDPRTGYPAETGLAAVAVILPLAAGEGMPPAWQGHMGMLSDMLSTAVFVLGPDAGRALLAEFPSALVILIGTDGTMIGD